MGNQRNKRFRSITLVIAATGLWVVSLSGCQVQPRTASPGRTIKDGEQVWDYGRVRPQEINENLTPQQLERMFVALEDIPREELREGEDPNRVIRPAPKRTGPDSQVKARKAYLQGRELISQSAFDRAIPVLAQGLESDPNSAAIHELLAKAYYHQNDYAAAELAAQQTLQCDDDNITAYHILGTIRLMQNELARALSFYDRALSCGKATSENPTTVLLHLQLARVLMKMDYLHAAVREYETTYDLLYQQRHYIQADPSIEILTRQAHLPLLTMASLYVRMGQIEQAVQALLKTQKLFSTRVDLVHAFVTSLAGQRKPIQARSREVTVFCRYLIAARYHVDHVLDIYYQACQKMAIYQDYVDALERWYSPMPPNQGILLKREYAYGLYLAERDEQAETIWLELTTQPPSRETALVHRDLAHLYRRKHNWQGMLLHYGWFLEMRPTVIDALSKKIEEQAASIADLDSLLDQWKHDESLSNHYGCSFLLGLLAERQGNQELAQWYYQRALSKQMDFEPARTRLLELLLEREQYSKLIRWIQKYDPNEQATPSLCWFAGNAYAGMGQTSEAVRCFQQVIQQDAGHIQAYLGLSVAWVRQEEFVQAEKVLQYVQQAWPGRQEIDPYWLILYAAWSTQPCQNDSFYPAVEKRACQAMRIVCKEDPTLETLVSDRTLPVSSEVKYVISVLSEFVQKYPDCRTLGMIFARLLFDVGDYDQAVHQIDRVLARYPTHSQALSMGALFHEKIDDYVWAGEYRQRIWQQQPENPDLLVKTLITLDRGRQSQKALDLLLTAWQQSVRQDPQTIRILQPRTLRLFQATRRYEQAVELYQRWFEITKPNDKIAEPNDVIVRLYNDIIDTVISSFGLTDDDIVEPNDVIAMPTDEKKENGEGWLHLAVTNHLIWARIENGDYPCAFERVKAFQKRYDPKEPQMAIYLARTLNIRFQYERSAEWLGQLLQISPENESLRLQYYLAQIQQGQVKEALAAAKAWVAEQPGQKQRLKVLTVLLRREGQYEQAVQRLRQYLEATPNDHDIRFDLIDTLRENGSYDEAEKELSAIPQRGRWMSQRLDSQIKIDIARGQYQRALNRIDALAKGKRSLELEQIKLEILVSSGQAQKAAERIETLIEEYPGAPINQLWYSDLLTRQDKADEAIVFLESLLQKQPHDALLKNNLAYTLIEANREPQRARRLLEESLHAEPVSGPTLDSMGWLYYKEGNFEQALGYIYQAAAMMAMLDPEVLDHLGDTVYRLGQHDQARRYWHQAVTILIHRSPTEKTVGSDKERIEEKIRQLDTGQEVTVAGLFSDSCMGVH